ncbi:histidine phosphatase superfamily [Gamsiella multidivaricata]|uniref:histidine phosphatase superfamily n=1 Tax=Gamsiella multidivaricata TaxID=101098 RepID=UPI00221EBCB7|nr:histidine phosphatase superfamily [Gamsiella multidivaricata]KAG0369805.1 hypothetical protein BGZ54_008800 [Gamsiella multidivaricata]KAI7827149.1 histidine phosphatase superfamily [Gamsiella multidivaricata]
MKIVLFRHGHSLANQESRIVSSLENGTRTTGGPEGTGFGLSDKGNQEVEESAESLVNHILSTIEPSMHTWVRILTSPFLRTRETAAIVDKVLRTAFAAHTHRHEHPAASPSTPSANKSTVSMEVIPKEIHDLRERFFGEFEMEMPSDELYARVWHEDASDPFHDRFGVESVAEVTKRMTAVVRDQEFAEKKRLERPYESDEELLVAKQTKIWTILVSHGDSLQILQAAMRGWSGDRHRQVDHLNTANWRIVQWCEELAEAHPLIR